MEQHEVEEPLPRILVLGASRMAGRSVTSFAWDHLPPDLNVADYDTVILDFTPWVVDRRLAEGLVVDSLPTTQQFARLLFSEGGEVVAIGVPDARAGGGPDGPYQTATWWLPAFPPLVVESGEAIRVVDEAFGFYFDAVKRYGFHVGSELVIARDSWAIEYVRSAVPEAVDFRGVLRPIAATRFHQAIGFAINLVAFREGSSRSKVEVARVSGDAIWLPSPTEVSSREAIELLLAERYGVRSERPMPEWAAQYSLPREQPVRQQIDELNLALQEEMSELATAQQRLRSESRFRILLYERGEDVLEPVVRDALRALGADVADPTVKGREDGRLIDPGGRRGMLEVKGRRGALRLADVRELDQWVRDALINESLASKGLLIVNALRTSPLRPTPSLSTELLGGRSALRPLSIDYHPAFPGAGPDTDGRLLKG